MIRVTGSRLALLAECQYFARPDVEWSEQKSASASFGTRLHAMCEAQIEGRDPKCGDDVEVGAVFANVVSPWLRANRLAGWRAEVPFAIDVYAGTARELRKGEHREYVGAGNDDLCLTTDVVYMAEDGDGPFACVDDFKWSGFHGDEQKAQAQLTAQAVAVAKAWGADRVRARAIRISEDRIDDTAEVYWLDVFDIAEAIETMRELLAKVPTAEPREGDHCRARWCPALVSCPSTTAIVDQIIPADALARKEWRFTPTIESPDHLERILAMLPVASEFVERVRKATAACVAEGPVKTSDGREIYQAYRTMPRTNMSAVLDLAKQLGATDEQLSLCVRTSQEPNGVRVKGGGKKSRKA
jgi:hypothetical protein